MAAFIKQELGINVKIDSDGKIGEFTVLVGEKRVFEKDMLKFPDKKAILESIKKELQIP